jgi:hypothetical protein
LDIAYGWNKWSQPIGIGRVIEDQQTWANECLQEATCAYCRIPHSRDRQISEIAAFHGIGDADSSRERSKVAE